MSQEPESTGEIRNPDGTFKKGVSGNPAGRPAGSVSIKDKIRQHLENNPEVVEDIVAHFVKDNRELMWQMLEGRPAQDVTSGGQPLPTPIYAGQSISDTGHHSDTEDIPAEEENTSG